MSNKVTFGLTMCIMHLAIKQEDGSWTFATPKTLRRSTRDTN